GASFEMGIRRCDRVLVVSCATANDAPNATSAAAPVIVLELIRNGIGSPFEVVLACPRGRQPGEEFGTTPDPSNDVLRRGTRDRAEAGPVPSVFVRDK